VLEGLLHLKLSQFIHFHVVEIASTAYSNGVVNLNLFTERFPALKRCVTYQCGDAAAVVPILGGLNCHLAYFAGVEDPLVYMQIVANLVTLGVGILLSWDHHEIHIPMRGAWARLESARMVFQGKVPGPPCFSKPVNELYLSHVDADLLKLDIQHLQCDHALEFNEAISKAIVDDTSIPDELRRYRAHLQSSTPFCDGRQLDHLQIKDIPKPSADSASVVNFLGRIVRVTTAAFGLTPAHHLVMDSMCTKNYHTHGHWWKRKGARVAEKTRGVQDSKEAHRPILSVEKHKQTRWNLGRGNFDAEADIAAVETCTKQFVDLVKAGQPAQRKSRR
jgi:hypothetical protein